MTTRHGAPLGRYLITTWDGGGNLPVALGVAEGLAERGHDVRLMAHSSIDKRCGRHGWRFRPFLHGPEFDSCRVADLSKEIESNLAQLWCNPALADDVLEELEAEPADVVAVDCVLYGAMCAAIASSTRSVGLFHLPYSTPFGGMPIGLDTLNPLRARLGLEPIATLGDVWKGLDLALVATPREFESTETFPAHVHHVGPILDGPPLMAGLDEEDLVMPSGREPLVLVSMSTSYQNQLETLHRITAALSELPVRVLLTSGPAVDPSSLHVPPNVTVRPYLPHERILPSVSVVITHAGLGTIMTSLRHGVPLLCIPMGRDQGLNAMTVQQLGAGRTLPPDASIVDIASCTAALLAKDAPERAAARKLASAFADYGGTTQAVNLIEAILPRNKST